MRSDYSMTAGILSASLILWAASSPGSAIAQEHPHEDHDHAEGGHEGQARHIGHESGFPEFVDIFFTHHAYLERKLRPRVIPTPGEEENEFEEIVELSWKFNHWLFVELNGVTSLTDEEGDEEHEDEEEHEALVPAGRRVALASSGGGLGEEDTLVSLTLGFRYGFANHQQWGGGIQFP